MVRPSESAPVSCHPPVNAITVTTRARRRSESAHSPDPKSVAQSISTHLPQRGNPPVPDRLFLGRMFCPEGQSPWLW